MPVMIITFACVGELCTNILYTWSDQFGRSSTTADAEWCISAIILAIWCISSCRRLRSWSVSDWTATTGIFLSLHGWKRGCMNRAFSACSALETLHVQFLLCALIETLTITLYFEFYCYFWYFVGNLWHFCCLLHTCLSQTEHISHYDRNNTGARLCSDCSRAILLFWLSIGSWLLIYGQHQFLKLAVCRYCIVISFKEVLVLVIADVQLTVGCRLRSEPLLM